MELVERENWKKLLWLLLPVAGVLVIHIIAFVRNYKNIYALRIYTKARIIFICISSLIVTYFVPIIIVCIACMGNEQLTQILILCVMCLGAVFAIMVENFIYKKTVTYYDRKKKKLNNYNR